jgi:N-acetylmuramoyl-L-alanine amidase
MDHDIKRRLLHEAVQDNLAISTRASALTGTATVLPFAPVPRPLWVAVAKIVYLAAALVFVLVDDRSTVISTVIAPPMPRPELVASPPPLTLPTLPWVDAQGAMPAEYATVRESPTLPEEGEQERGEHVEPLFPAPAPIDLAVLPLGIKKIILDPGHGGKDVGTSIALGLTEKGLTLDIALRLRHLLEAEAFEVLMTRDKDEAVPLRQRTALANTQRADLFVSIHINWVERSHARGVETYYLGPTDDPALLRLAAQENHDSGYSLADFRKLLDQIYLSVRREESRRLAEAVQRTLVTTLHPHNPVRANRGVKTAPFAVLAGTEMPAILAEVACLSNAEEAQLLATPQYRQDIARALVQGIRAYAQALNRSPQLSQKGN